MFVRENFRCDCCVRFAMYKRLAFECGWLAVCISVFGVLVCLCSPVLALLYGISRLFVLFGVSFQLKLNVVCIKKSNILVVN